MDSSAKGAFAEYFILMENSKIHCLYTSLLAVLSWRPRYALQGPLVIHKVMLCDGVFKTQLIGVSPEAFVPLEPSQRPYPPSEGV